MQTLSLSLNITSTTISYNNNNEKKTNACTIYSCNLQCDKCEMRKRYRFYNREKKAFNKRNPVERMNASHRTHHCEPWFYVRLMQMRWIERSMNNRIWCDKRTSKNRVRNVLASILLFFILRFFCLFSYFCWHIWCVYVYEFMLGMWRSKVESQSPLYAKGGLNCF